MLFLCVQNRHRAVNLFLQGYEKSWIEAEEPYFEDKLIDDLAVSDKHNLKTGPLDINSFKVTCWLFNIILSTLGKISLAAKVGG